jgi:hypothetical protein
MSVAEAEEHQARRVLRMEQALDRGVPFGIATADTF